MFYASKNDAIPDEVWKRWSEATAWWLTFPRGPCLVECAAGSVHGKLHYFRGFLDQGKPDRCPSDEAMAGVHLLLTATPDQPGHSPPLWSSPPRDCGTRRVRLAGLPPPQAASLPRFPDRPRPGHRMARFPIVRGAAIDGHGWSAGDTRKPESHHGVANGWPGTEPNLRHAEISRAVERCQAGLFLG